MVRRSASGPLIKKKTGGVMFEVTEKASEMIKEFLKNQKDQQTIRITLQAG